MKMYILIETTGLTADTVRAYLRALDTEDVTVRDADTVVGEYDIVASLESHSLDSLDTVVHERILGHPHIERITTCLVADPPPAIIAAQPSDYSALAAATR